MNFHINGMEIDEYIEQIATRNYMNGFIAGFIACGLSTGALVLTLMVVGKL